MFTFLLQMTEQVVGEERSVCEVAGGLETQLPFRARSRSFFALLTKKKTSLSGMAKEAAEKFAAERRLGSAGLQARVARDFEGWL